MAQRLQWLSGFAAVMDLPTTPQEVQIETVNECGMDSCPGGWELRCVLAFCYMCMHAPAAAGVVLHRLTRTASATCIELTCILRAATDDKVLTAVCCMGGPTKGVRLGPLLLSCCPPAVSQANASTSPCRSYVRVNEMSLIYSMLQRRRRKPWLWVDSCAVHPQTDLRLLTLHRLKLATQRTIVCACKS
jgi:hypothetical protein